MYSYYNLLDDVNYLAHYGVSTGSVGVSVSGLNLPYVHLGKFSGKQIIITGAIHAREHVSALLIIKQIIAQLNSGVSLSGGIYFVPMVNPDGNLLVSGGASLFPTHSLELIKINGGSIDFSLWKANINGVDLNCNFDAHFGGGDQNVFYPSPSGYVGEHAFSERESIALRDFTLRIAPVATISYHALGQEIYWRFYQNKQNAKRDLAFCKHVNSFLNYHILADENSSAGGYKDWCVSALKIPSLTIELVSEKFTHPLPDDSIAEDLPKNLFLPQKILEYFNSDELYTK